MHYTLNVKTSIAYRLSRLLIQVIGVMHVLLDVGITNYIAPGLKLIFHMIICIV